MNASSASALLEVAALVAVSLPAAHFTHRLCHRRAWGPVRASAGLVLAFLAATHALGWVLPGVAPHLPRLEAAFFGATFVGLSDPANLPERHVLLAAAVFAVGFAGISRLHLGLGGMLGTTAFAACLTVAALGRLRRAPLSGARTRADNPPS